MVSKKENDWLYKQAQAEIDCAECIRRLKAVRLFPVTIKKSFLRMSECAFASKKFTSAEAAEFYLQAVSVHVEARNNVPLTPWSYFFSANNKISANNRIPNRMNPFPEQKPLFSHNNKYLPLTLCFLLGAHFIQIPHLHTRLMATFSRTQKERKTYEGANNLFKAP